MYGGRVAAGVRRVGSLLVAVAILLPALAGADHNVINLISVGPSEGEGASDAGFGGASRDGSTVVFTTAEPLVSADTDGQIDVYERTDGTTTLASTGPEGGNGALGAHFSGVSGDGSRVFFATAEALVSADTDRQYDVYERAGDTTTLISSGPDGGNGELAAVFAHASGDGSRALFITSEPLVAADTDGQVDVYERADGTTTLMSVGPGGGNGAFNVSFRGASRDGSRIFFDTVESLASSDTDGAVDIYERAGGTTTLISAGPGGGNGGFGARFAGASLDGSRVFFSTSESLVSADSDGRDDVYGRIGNATGLISTGPDGGNGAFEARFGDAAQDGSRVLFTTAEGLVGADTDGRADVYGRGEGGTTLISTGPDGGNGPFDAGFARLSADGSSAFFATAESLASADTDGFADVYQRRVGGENTLISTGPDGGNGSFNAYFNGASGDGSRAFFSTDESLVSSDSDRRLDVYERAAVGRTTLISTGVDRGEGAFDAFFRGGSLDGSRVFLTTRESLVSTDEDAGEDLYERRIQLLVGGAPPAPQSPTGPGLALSGRRIQRLGRAVTVVARATTRRCRVSASGTVAVPDASKVFRLTRAKGRILARGARTRLALGLPPEARRAAEGALSSGRTVRARLTVRARDAAGKTTVRRRAVRLTLG